CLQYNDRPFTF
nr:immunoglobulin light chain junction region [Macaca mulatta]